MVRAQRSGGWILAMALAGAALDGCGRGGGAKDRAAVNTGLNTLLETGAARSAPRAPAPPRKVEPAPNSNLAELIKQQAVDTERLLADLDTGRKAGPPAPRPPSPGPGVAARPEAVTDAAPAEATPVPTATVGAAAPQERDPAESAAPVERPLADRIDDATGALIELLRQQASEPPGSMRAAAALAGLEVLRSGVAPRAGEAQGLTPAQQTAVEALRDAAGLVGEASRQEWTGPEAGALADQLGEIAERVSSTQPLRIREARLCTRVLGFGQYTPLGDGLSARMVAGRAQSAIVYVEVDRFAHRETGEGDETLSSAREQGDRWAVELTQEINLYSDAGNLLVLRHPPERVLETSRVKRRDFYLVREISLPPTLGAGRYNLKVTVRDRTAGTVAESVIPVEVVADAGLARPR